MAKNKNTVVEPVENTTEIEAPYELPEGWKWCRLGELFSHVTGKALKKENQKGIKKRYITTSNIYWGTFDFSEIREMYFEENELDKCTAKKGDLLVCNGGDIGRSAIWNYDYDICLQNHVSKLRKLNDTVLPQFYYYLMLFYKNSGFLNGKGIGISSLSAKDLLNLTVPVSTLEEQQRIVNRIETLFAKLDEAKEKAQNVVDTFETRKAAILHKAFTGELTKKWREENGVGDDSWEEKTISDVCIPKAGFAFDSKKFTSSGYQVIRMGNLYAGEIDLTRSPVFYSESEINQSILDRALIKDGDILITLTGTKYKQDYGYAVIFRNPDKLLVNQRILCLRPTDSVKESYILNYLKSKMFRDIFFSNETGGVNQGNVSSKFVESIPINLPTLPEQTEIVRILDVILEKETKAKESAEAVLEQIDLLKKSILARAFRGEL